MTRKMHVAAALTAMVWLAAAIPADVAAQSPASPSAPWTSPNSSVQPHNEMGVWHHFGEGQSKAAPAPSQSGGWHHFGEAENPLPRAVPARRPYYGLSRTQEMERQMLEMVNLDRADPANASETHDRAYRLQWNDQLAAVARAHSLDMMRQGYFDHQDPQGRNVAGRVEAAGIPWQALGENIAIAGSAASAEGLFMNEPKFAKNHRANILNTTFTEVGIGIVQGPDGRVYITQDFCTPPAPR